MPQDDVFAPSWAPRMLSVLRIMTALLFLAHGTQKLFGFPTPQYQPPVQATQPAGAHGASPWVGTLVRVVLLLVLAAAAYLLGRWLLARLRVWLREELDRLERDLPGEGQLSLLAGESSAVVSIDKNRKK